VLGAYEVNRGGEIVDARLLIDNVEADHGVGFFIVQDAADWAATLGAGDALSFVNAGGAPASIADGTDVRLAVNGVAVDQTVFHRYDAGLNVDGVQNALSGVEVGGEAITLGFEDFAGGGDQDDEDAVFTVTKVLDEVI
jgi:hypothetical protein